jgi:hypothetical protein
LGHLRSVFVLFQLLRGFFGLICTVFGGLEPLRSDIGAFSSCFRFFLGHLGVILGAVKPFGLFRAVLEPSRA